MTTAQPGQLDAAVVPRPAATVVLLRDSPAGPETLLLRRSADAPFVPGAHVFPGGSLDLRDHAAELRPYLRGRDDVSSSAVLGIPTGGLAYWVAALRECLEEVGVVVARTADDAPVDAAHPLVAALPGLRPDIHSGALHLAELCARHDVVLAVDSVRYLAHWVTPVGGPRRYDTRFFAVPMPPGQSAEPDRWEAVDAGWHRPTQALAEFAADRMDLIEPTVHTLQLLSGYRRVDDIMSALARAETSGARVRHGSGGVSVAIRGEDDGPPADRGARP